MDTGPSLVTFPGVWKEFLRRWDAADGQAGEAAEIADLRLKRLPEVDGITTAARQRRCQWRKAIPGVRHGSVLPEYTVDSGLRSRGY